MWVELFKRDHDDTHFYKNAVDDFSFCSLINYRNKHANYITVLQSLMENNIYDPAKDTSKSFDLDFVAKIASVFPNFVIDSLNKTQNDDDNDIAIKKAFSSSFVSSIYSQMLLLSYNNVFITHSYNKTDVLKEFSGVYNRYRNIFIWRMKHGIKTMKNKFFLGKGIGGY